MKSESKDSPIKIVAENRKARFDYEILDKYEAGLVLTGPEIKSVRSGGITISEAYVRPDGDEVFLLGAHIAPYKFSAQTDYNPTRSRKLLLNAREIAKLRARVEEKGLTIVPLKVYLKRGFAKIEIGIARGKAAPDKRSAIKDREGKREIARVLKRG